MRQQHRGWAGSAAYENSGRLVVFLARDWTLHYLLAQHLENLDRLASYLQLLVVPIISRVTLRCGNNKESGIEKCARRVRVRDSFCRELGRAYGVRCGSIWNSGEDLGGHVGSVEGGEEKRGPVLTVAASLEEMSNVAGTAQFENGEVEFRYSSGASGNAVWRLGCNGIKSLEALWDKDWRLSSTVLGYRDPRRNRWWTSTDSEEPGEVSGKKECAGEQWHGKVSEQGFQVLVKKQTHLPCQECATLAKDADGWSALCGVWQRTDMNKLGVVADERYGPEEMGKSAREMDLSRAYETSARGMKREDYVLVEEHERRDDG